MKSPPWHDDDDRNELAFRNRTFLHCTLVMQPCQASHTPFMTELQGRLLFIRTSESPLGKGWAAMRPDLDDLVERWGKKHSVHFRYNSHYECGVSISWTDIRSPDSIIFILLTLTGIQVFWAGRAGRLSALLCISNSRSRRLREAIDEWVVPGASSIWRGTGTP